MSMQYEDGYPAALRDLSDHNEVRGREGNWNRVVRQLFRPSGILDVSLGRY